MVSHGHEPPTEAVLLQEGGTGRPPRARAAVASLTPGRSAPWIAQAARAGTRIFADVGWDETGAWDLSGLADLEHCEAFLPNAEEGEAVHRRRLPAAGRARPDRVRAGGRGDPRGGGAYAVDRRTGEAAEVPAIAVEALDPTGAGTSSSPGSSPVPWRGGRSPTGWPSPGSRPRCRCRSSGVAVGAGVVGDRGLVAARAVASRAGPEGVAAVRVPGGPGPGGAGPALAAAAGRADHRVPPVGLTAAGKAGPAGAPGRDAVVRKALQACQPPVVPWNREAALSCAAVTRRKRRP